LIAAKAQSSGVQSPGKREINREARRNDIIEAGLLEFTAQGFTSTRLEDVAERAGIGKGTIYLYFDSKQKLFEEVVRKNLFSARDRAVSLVEEFSGTATELLIMHINNMYQFFNKDNIPQLLAVVIGEVNRFPELAEFFFNEMVGQGQGALSLIIQKGVKSGEFRDTDLKHYSQIMIAPIILGAIWKIQFDVFSPVDSEAYAKTHIDLILNVLKPL
jgi:AcrR family transcriptional regulator